MIRILGQIFLALILITVVLAVKCSIQNKIYNSDPVIQNKLTEFKSESQPLKEALEKYHSVHGYYPISANNLPLSDNLSRYYVVTQFNRVYKSLECRQKECISGYSEFYLKKLLKSWDLRVKVYGEFSSQTSQWSVCWREVRDRNINDNCAEGDR